MVNSWDPMGFHRDTEALLNPVDVAVQEATAASVGISGAHGIAALVCGVTRGVGAAAPAPMSKRKQVQKGVRICIGAYRRFLFLVSHIFLVISGFQCL